MSDTTPTRDFQIIAPEPLVVTNAGRRYVIPPFGILKLGRLADAGKRAQAAGERGDDIAYTEAAVDLITAGVLEELPDGTRQPLTREEVGETMPAALINELVQAVFEQVQAGQGEAPEPPSQAARRKAAQA